MNNFRFALLFLLTSLWACSNAKFEVEQRDDRSVKARQGQSAKNPNNSGDSTAKLGTEVDPNATGTPTDAGKDPAADPGTDPNATPTNNGNDGGTNPGGDKGAVAQNPTGKGNEPDPTQPCPYFDPNDPKSKPTYMHTFTVGNAGQFSIAIFAEDANGNKTYGGGYENDGRTYLFKPYAWYHIDTRQWSLTAPGDPTHWLAYKWTVKIENAHLATCSINNNLDQAAYLKGCFASDSLITMANGKKVRLETLKPGDRLYNPFSNQASIIMAILSPMSITSKVVTLGYSDKTLTLTGNHPMLTKAGLKTAAEVTKADFLLGSDSRFYKVSKVNQRNLLPSDRFLNIALDTDSRSLQSHIVVANDIAAGDLFLQMQLEKVKTRKAVGSDAFAAIQNLRTSSF